MKFLCICAALGLGAIATAAFSADGSRVITALLGVNALAVAALGGIIWLRDQPLSIEITHEFDIVDRKVD